MSSKVPGTRITVEFDEHGRMRIKNPGEAQIVLDQLAKNPRLDIILGPEPLPNTTLACGLRPPNPNGERGCPNTQCPMELWVGLAPLIHEERQRILDERNDR